VHLTASGAILGTPAYMAPEQARGESVDHRCDLFSLGVVLYNMATGRLPFSGNTTIAVLTSLATDNPMSPQLVNSELPAELSDLIMQLLTKDPAGRPASTKEVAERLGKIERRLSLGAVILDQTEERPVGAAPASSAGVEMAETVRLAPQPPLPHSPLVAPSATRRNKGRMFTAVALLILGPLGC
jgi:serine/threonine protein kinase